MKTTMIPALTVLALATGAAHAQGLDAPAVAALRAALDDERLAQATYQQVMQRFGPIRPFVHIVRAEARHEAMLLDLFRKHRIDVPENRYTKAPPAAPGTLRGAFEAAVKAEKENIALYDRFLNTVKEPEVRTVFQRLQAASRNNHLPAFQRGVHRT